MNARKKSAGITLQIILEHIRAMEQRIMTKFEKADDRLDRIERKLVMISVQIENLDKRLDDIEVVQIPKLKKWAGIR